ncbi:Hypothetical protein NTJ_07500 [Nesidiocoris tenuis]|uniref:Uncharacterized protein n=1 Tax=Nesidiocoris tenuis TaxID=355587 RepID=A0ABN7AR63_9HEMI|nr:Hypothetical protein NTJ_07500 [Nesidiocoris tenuis]
MELGTRLFGMSRRPFLPARCPPRARLMASLPHGGPIESLRLLPLLFAPYRRRAARIKILPARSAGRTAGGPRKGGKGCRPPAMYPNRPNVMEP